MEVTQLLKKRGVDLEHNRFLILQGEVEQISLMKPKALTPHEEGLLEYLEERLGRSGALNWMASGDRACGRETPRLNLCSPPACCGC